MQTRTSLELIVQPAAKADDHQAEAEKLEEAGGLDRQRLFMADRLALLGGEVLLRPELRAEEAGRERAADRAIAIELELGADIADDRPRRRSSCRRR